MILASLLHFGAGGAALKAMPTAFKGETASNLPYLRHQRPVFAKTSINLHLCIDPAQIL
jgi:hypothetical protein